MFSNMNHAPCHYGGGVFFYQNDELSSGEW